MISNHGSFDSPGISSKIQAVYGNSSPQNFRSRLYAGLVCSFCQNRGKPPACHRRKLSALINDTCDTVRKIRTSHTVYDHAANCQLALVTLSSGDVLFTRDASSCFFAASCCCSATSSVSCSSNCCSLLAISSLVPR